VSWFPERAWWGPTAPGQWWSAQPVAHATGGVVVTLVAMIVWPDLAWFRVLVWTGFWAGWWQLRQLECQEDSGYELRWALYDVVTAVLVALPLLAMRALLI